jgi:transcriptional regulator with XRE-family HTH domain
MPLEQLPDLLSPVEERIARALADLRSSRGWSLENVASQTGISRATLSRIERGELSPTAAMLGKLCSLYGLTLSRLMADAESSAPSFVPVGAQARWTDPASGYTRTMVSPPAPGLRGEMVEIRLPAGAVVDYAAAPVAGLEHHLWMLAGALELQVGGSSFGLGTGDCVRYVLNGPSRFHNRGRREARYVIALVHP